MLQAKKNVGDYAARFVKQGMSLGIGSGSTVYWFIQELGQRIKEGLQITAVATSKETAQLAEQANIPITDLDHVEQLAITIDGADEIDLHGQLVKGGGGALLQEKIVAAASRELIIIADRSKLVSQLGKFPLPVEVIPFGYKQVARRIMNMGICKNVVLRKRQGEIFITDHHHYILDCEFGKITDPSTVNTTLHSIPGIVETGLFINMASKAVIGDEDGRVEVIDYK